MKTTFPSREGMSFSGLKLVTPVLPAEGLNALPMMRVGMGNVF